MVNDGSFRAEDGRILDAIADRFGVTLLTQQNSGLGRARNFGISQSRGTYVLPLDPDDLLEPQFVERCAAVLESRPELAYVNTWSRYIAEDGHEYGSPSAGYRPFSNEATSLGERNVAGPATALIRRSVFEDGFWYSVDSTSYEDWLLYQELAAAGLVGHTIPEQLFVYRVRKESMFRAFAEPHHERLMDELANHRLERAVQWTSGPEDSEHATELTPPVRAASASERLEQANRELRSTNARLARSKWAKADSAAASLAAKLELERRTLEERRLQDRDRAGGAAEGDRGASRVGARPGATVGRDQGHARLAAGERVLDGTRCREASRAPAGRRVTPLALDGAAGELAFLAWVEPLSTLSSPSAACCS